MKPTRPSTRPEVIVDSDDKEPRGSPDDQTINVSDCDELRHWSRLFRITPEELKAAVARIGTSPTRMREYLASTTRV